MAIPISGTLEPAGKFPLVEARSVSVTDEQRLDEYLNEQESELNGLMNTALTQMASMMATDSSLNKRTTALEAALEDLSVSYPIETSGTALQPETYYAFGEVGSLSVTLVEPNDGKVHEYCFEFKPTTENFALTVTPGVTWAKEPQYPVGKTCQVSILRGIGVMVCA